ncbi:MAG: Transcriptional regulator of nonfermentable carbon utilization [Claussenomyces sp. TS43310]|nr:MAG: Transcriptional regulator of nonfermentable carbon utilization [Claussenomyces sp. TS43310]
MPDDNEIEEGSDGPSDNEYDEADGDKDERDDDEEEDDIMAESTLKQGEEGRDGASVVKKPKVDPKDPLRPRRKKARRACFACQRAHLTCGDERPCARCVKRGLGEACQDGVRKKAKYLHDAPPEALRPVLGPTYNATTNGRATEISRRASESDTSPGIGGFYPQSNPSPHYPMQYQSMHQTTMPAPASNSASYPDQQQPPSPAYASAAPNQHPSSVPGLVPAGTANAEAQNNSAFGGPMFDPSNPALFNFDLEGLNFGNHYGALEFGMLNHMSSGAAETPPQDKNGSLSKASEVYGAKSAFNGNNNNSISQYGHVYSQPDTMIPDFGSMDRHNSSGSIFDTQRAPGMPRAFAIESGHGSIPSPGTDAQASPQSLGFDGSPSTTTYNTVAGTHSLPHGQGPQHRGRRQEAKATPRFSDQSSINTAIRIRDPSTIYSTVTEPYPYTTGFHNLTALVQRRFSASKTLKIAKSLASIRPSFISCTKTLNRQDLIFMEKCFQRTLFEFEEHMLHWGTPTLVCRRTGEVAAVNKEFTLLTGWTKSVLLGKEPNLNANMGNPSQSSSEPPSLNNSGRAGLSTPRLRPMTAEKSPDGKPHSVFLAELLDDDSVIDFYEDFAKLAFADSRNSVTRRCKVLKYRPKELQANVSEIKDEHGSGDRPRGGDVGNGTVLGARVTRIDGEQGIGRLERDGKIDCAYCWTVKRDVFDIPMLIVMNFLPCI